MAQQVWAFLTNERNRSLWWTVPDFTAGQHMPESTVRGQLDRLIRAGKVEARYSKELGRFCFRVAQ
jgi:hypothetical protein